MGKIEASKQNSLQAIRHSLAHLLAMAVLEKFPEAKLGIGPTIENGFYYDFENISISPEDLPGLEKKIKELIKKDIKFEKEEIDTKKAKDIFVNQPYKIELINELKEKPTIYKSGNFTDLCAGPHIENTKEINPDAFKLTKIAGAYWKGNEKNPMLTRIYGLAFDTKKELDDYLKMLEEAEKRDHRKLGKDLGLFVFSPVVGKGLPLWTEKGAIIIKELEEFIVNEEIKRGYKHVRTPDMAKLDLYKKSGHYPYYKDSMYAPIKIDEEEFMLRPMSCPHHFELYLSKPKSYKDLPVRIAELAKLYRYEQSGELTGLIRLRGFCLADAHIICADKNQAGEEIEKALDLIEFALNKFGLEMGKNYWYQLSLGDRNNDKKYYKDDKAWDDAEDILKKLLKKRKCKFVEAEGEAAFYGPKIDIQMKNVLGKEDTAFTVQYDFVMPEKFNLTYKDKDGKDKKTIVIHRSSIGAIERTIAFLLEHYAGALPFWLSPVQTQIIPVSEKFNDYGEKVLNELKENNIRAEIDDSNETLGKRIRNAELQKIPYILVVGEKEKEAKTVTMRERNKEKQEIIKIEEFIKKTKKE